MPSTPSLPLAAPLWEGLAQGGPRDTHPYPGRPGAMLPLTSGLPLVLGRPQVRLRHQLLLGPAGRQRPAGSQRILRPCHPPPTEDGACFTS